MKAKKAKKSPHNMEKRNHFMTESEIQPVKNRVHLLRMRLKYLTDVLEHGLGVMDCCSTDPSYDGGDIPKILRVIEGSLEEAYQCLCSNSSSFDPHIFEDGSRRYWP